MRCSRLLLPTFALVLLATPAHASVASDDSGRIILPTTSDSGRGVSRPDGERMPEEVRAQVESHRAQARAYWEAGRTAQARREFLAAGRLMTAAGVLPTEELLAAATLALVEERPRVAAEVMDTLAANAITLGQPQVQARALLEAASQYAIAGQKDVARERFAALRALLASPYITDSFRSEVADRTAAQR